MTRGEFSRPTPNMLPPSSVASRLGANLPLLRHFYFDFHEPFYQQSSQETLAYGEYDGTLILAQHEQLKPYDDPATYHVVQFIPELFDTDATQAIVDWSVTGTTLSQDMSYFPSHERTLFLQDTCEDDLTARLILRGGIGNEWQTGTQRGLLASAHLLAANALYIHQKKLAYTADELLEKLQTEQP